MSDDKDLLISKLVNSLIKLSLIIIALILFVIYLMFRLPINAQQEEIAFCGNTAIEYNAQKKARNEFGDEIDLSKGKKLFKANCSSCHTANENTLVGPGLKNVFTDGIKNPELWFINYTKNPEKIFNSKNKRAVELRKSFGEFPMMTFNELTDQEIKEIMAYVKYNNFY